MSNEEKKEPKKSGRPKISYYWIYALIAVVLLGFNLINLDPRVKEVAPNEFYQMVKENDIEKIKVINEKYANIYIKSSLISTDSAAFKKKYEKVGKSPLFKSVNKGPHYQIEIGEVKVFNDNLATLQKDIPFEQRLAPEYETRTNWIGPLINIGLPLLILVGLMVFLMRRMGNAAGGPGGQIFNIGKSKATLFDQNTKVNVTFKDVAGLDEAKEEVMEVVDFLKNPSKYTNLGGKIPKGVLLVGSPGTGKTLLAKAVAGEAAVPFFSMSGSDFVEMFVGVGASRVRDLFKQAREKAPCIIFIDEIDAIGRARGKGNMSGGNDERENTLNQLLVEMDGFSTDKGVIIMAASNRPDVLDSALLRPGRFDRQIGIDKPDLAGREAIFKVHLRNIKISPKISAKTLAEQTPGFAGAEIANVCNEAALIAARRNKREVEMDDFQYALDRVIGGLEKKNKIIAPREKKTIAYHEAGHAICGWFLEHASPLVKVTIVPRGIGTLGYAQYLPKDEYITTTEQLLDRMCMTLGGRAAERIIFDKISTGAQSDLDQVTKMGYSMIAVFGMNEKVGNVSFYDMQNQNQFAKPYSDDTARLIDTEVRKLIDTQYDRAIALLKEKEDLLHKLANELLNTEVLLREDVERILGRRPADKILELKAKEEEQEDQPSTEDDSQDVANS